ncbi:hypothetical protein AGDE_00734 [Angomonas deanei]|nr:hypothetical protein AGDE_00734 [Angomonas deanei]|eukprot:EPY43188.1 hypothetical protein AGDE_00734 [Angomonas deanei]
MVHYRDNVLLPRVEEKKQQLQELEKVKQHCDKIATAYPRRHSLAQLGFLLFQLVILFDWTYIHFDWSLTEPITYVLGYSATWFAVLWYGNLQREFGYGSYRDLLEAKRRKQLYAECSVDEDQYEQLKEELAALEIQLRSLKNIEQ